jgi:predicted PurR-regulated permease PerM
MDHQRIFVFSFFALLAFITYELYAVLAPFLTPIAWAILLAFLAHPALVALNRIVRSRSLCALVITLMIALGVILPAVSLSAVLAREAQSLYATLSHVSGGDNLARASDWIQSTRPGAKLAATLASHGIKLEDEIRTIGIVSLKTVSNYLVKHGGAAASNVASFLFHFVIAMLTLFYLLRDGESWYDGIRELTPLEEDDKLAVFDNLRLTLSAVMRGLMLTALLDGLALGLGYLTLGVPYWELLALLTAAAGLLPIGGTALVWIPIAGYLAFTVGWTPAILLVAWAALVLALVDNVVKPLAMGHGTGLPTVALFFGLAGGVEAYGPLGIFAGPAIIALFASLLHVYRRTYVVEEITPATASEAPFATGSAAVIVETIPAGVSKLT